jgi:hypothetical protein
MTVNRNLTDQKATEARHVARFLELAHLEAQAIQGDRPDFVLVVGGRRLGLEHQELTEEDLARNERNLTGLQDDLRDELRRQGAAHDLHVAVGVNAASDVFRRRSDLPDLARRIAEIALPHAATVTREHPFEIRPHEIRPFGVAGVESLSVHRTRGALAGPLATVSRGFWGPVESSVLEAIREKEERLPVYVANTGVEEQWLLLVTGEGYVQATDSVLTRELREPTAFAHVYLMDLRTGALQRVDDHQAN